MDLEQVNRSNPAKTGISTGGTQDAFIRKDAAGNFWVDTLRIPSTGATVIWQSDGSYTADQIVVYFPEEEKAHRGNGKVTLKVGGPKGRYHYSLYVLEQGRYTAVEGNSPPEMIID